jgi:hypothetical protein
VARININALDKRAVQPNFPAAGVHPLPPPRDQMASDERRRLPPLRPALSLDNYTGPQQGELHWSGLVPKGRHVTIQGGKASTGMLTDDLPRVPVTVELVSGGARIIDPPSRHNNWDRLLIKNYSDSPLTDMVIRWKVSK